ncbi:hypothetical protein DLH72_03355 [Candidatus Gracilibacteria bacterium]|nr:MAG: hypothetical protein DLH72_03355 [Candidatus Gracilibacteria bacterium]
MNKKQILEELLENNPQIPEDKLKDILKVLLENNPDIKMDKDFRKNLKQKLKNISKTYEKPKIWNYFFFGAPLISAICIFTFFMFYFKDYTAKTPELYNHENMIPKNLQLKLEDEIYLDNSENIDLLFQETETSLKKTEKINTEKSIENLEKTDKINTEKNKIIESKQKEVQVEKFILEKNDDINIDDINIDDFIEENINDYENIKPVKIQNFEEISSPTLFGEEREKKEILEDDLEKKGEEKVEKQDYRFLPSQEGQERKQEGQEKTVETKKLEKSGTKKVENTELKIEKTIEKKDFESTCNLNGFKIIKEDGIIFCVNLEEKCSENDFKKSSCSFLK